jgi:hypothetical protein
MVCNNHPKALPGRVFFKKGIRVVGRNRIFRASGRQSDIPKRMGALAGRTRCCREMPETVVKIPHTVRKQKIFPISEIRKN